MRPVCLCRRPGIGTERCVRVGEKLGAEARSRALVSDGEAAETLYRAAIDRFGRTACGRI
jgi:hypothetical protein